MNRWPGKQGIDDWQSHAKHCIRQARNRETKFLPICLLFLQLTREFHESDRIPVKLKAIPAMLSMIPSVLMGVTPGDLQKIKAIVRATFPSVRQISPDALVEKLAQTQNPPLLIDVRPPAEFAVSHLRGALNLQTVREINRAIAERRPAEAILYCAVGYRSSRWALQLQEQSGLSVASLEGSIFQWANEGRRLFRGERPVRLVHPGGKKWAGLLNPGLASLTP